MVNKDENIIASWLTAQHIDKIRIVMTSMNQGAPWGGENSDVFKISVRRGRGAVSVKRVGCGGGAGPFPKKSHFLPQNDNLRCISTQFLTGRIFWNADFTVQSPNEAYKHDAKLSKNSRSNQGGGRTIAPPPEYATVGERPSEPWQLLWQVNRKLYPRFRMVPVWMILSEL